MEKAKSVEDLVFNGRNFITESPDGECLSVGKLFTNIWKTSKTKEALISNSHIDTFMSLTWTGASFIKSCAEQNHTLIDAEAH